MIGVVDVGWAFPNHQLHASEYANRVGIEESLVHSRIGIERRYVLGRNESEMALAASAFRNLREKSGFDDGEIDLLVYVSQNPERAMPHSAALLLAELDFKGKPATFDVALGCSAFPYALSICQGLMEAQGLSRAVVVTNDPYSRITTLDQPKTAAHFGDAATATFLQRDRGGAIMLGDFGTDGAHWDAIHLPKRSQRLSPSHLLDEPPLPHDDAYALRMNGALLASYFGKKIPESIATCAQKNQVELEQVDFIVLHQASKPMLELLGERLRAITSAEIPNQLRIGGNTSSSSIPLVLGRLMEEAPVQGKTAILAGFGVGLSWGSILLKF